MNSARPSLLRQLMAMLYDILLLLSVLFFASVLAVALNRGEAIPAGNPLFIFYLFFVSFVFYAWFWTHGGQTLGMRAWKIQLIGKHKKSIDWHQALIRYVFSIISLCSFGLGFFWQCIDSDGLTWHDKLAKTKVSFNDVN